MLQMDEPVISEYRAKEDYVKIKFWPDFKKFQMEGLEQDTVDLFTKRVYDLAGVMPSGVAIHLNGTEIEIKDFEEYSKMYLPEDAETCHFK